VIVLVMQATITVGERFVLRAHLELTRVAQVSLERSSCSFPLEPQGSVLLSSLQLCTINARVNATCD
jgi:hypothetical protein